ncbi:hypothetical protein Tco_0405393 [Tanacetum coccineum]
MWGERRRDSVGGSFYRELASSCEGSGLIENVVVKGNVAADHPGRGKKDREDKEESKLIETPTRGSFNKFTWYKNKAVYTRITTYSDQTRPDLTFVSTSWRHPWDPTLGITLTRMSAMANATPIVTTVTKTANKEKAPDAAPRVNILDFCEEHYEDILPIIMDKARHDKRKKIQQSPGQAGRTRETPPTVEAIASVGNVPESKTASGAPGDAYSQGNKTKYRDRSRDGDRSRSVKRWRESESPSSRV